MGRLFWKFFLFLWLAQLTSATGVGAMFWLKSQAPEAGAPLVDLSPPARFELAAAAATLRHGGVAALRDLLDERRGEAGPPVFALDAAHAEILGRTVSPEMLARIGELAADAGRSGVELVQAGNAPATPRYLLFVPQQHQPPGHGPGAGPGVHAPGERPSPPSRSHFPPLLPLVAGALASLVFAALLAWYFARPIRSLRSAFAAAADGRLEQRLAPEMGRRRDELADLGRDFDRMTGRLKSLMDSQRRLLHDVSHELRSPLARLQAAIGLVRQQPERYEDLLTRIERESVRMDRLVDELLTLSRLEAGMAGRFDETVELGELLAGVVEDASFEAETRACRVSFAADGNACVRGNAELLHRALENVVRNAVKHAPQASTIDVELGFDEHGQQVLIRVADRGAGVPEADLVAIFEPFFRCQNNPSADSHGLGLAIAQRVVTAHGGQIGARNRSGDGAAGGFVVSIRLPRLTAG